MSYLSSLSGRVMIIVFHTWSNRYGTEEKIQIEDSPIWGVSDITSPVQGSGGIPTQIARSADPAGSSSALFKIWTICHARDLWDIASSRVYYAHQTRAIYQVLSYAVDIEAHRDLWNRLSKTVLNKCSFILHKGLVNICNEREAKNK